MAEPKARVIDGMKLMWDGRDYAGPEEVAAARHQYEEGGFIVRTVEEDGQLRVYTRRVVTEAREGDAPA